MYGAQGNQETCMLRRKIKPGTNETGGIGVQSRCYGFARNLQG
jgi:hypothetical protein